MLIYVVADRCYCLSHRSNAASSPPSPEGSPCSSEQYGPARHAGSSIHVPRARSSLAGFIHRPHHSSPPVGGHLGRTASCPSLHEHARQLQHVHEFTDAHSAGQGTGSIQAVAPRWHNAQDVQGVLLEAETEPARPTRSRLALSHISRLPQWLRARAGAAPASASSLTGPTSSGPSASGSTAAAAAAGGKMGSVSPIMSKHKAAVSQHSGWRSASPLGTGESMDALAVSFTEGSMASRMSRALNGSLIAASVRVAARKASFLASYLTGVLPEGELRRLQQEHFERAAQEKRKQVGLRNCKHDWAHDPAAWIIPSPMFIPAYMLLFVFGDTPSL